MNKYLNKGFNSSRLCMYKKEKMFVNKKQKMVPINGR